MPRPQPQLIAGGNILPGRFVKLSTAADFTGLQATANAAILGVAGLGANYPPLSDLVGTNYHAQAGDPIDLKGDGEVVQVIAGDTISPGDRLKSDGNGAAVPIASTGTTIQHYGAVALQEAVAGDFVWVQVTANRSERPALA